VFLLFSFSLTLAEINIYKMSFLKNIFSSSTPEVAQPKIDWNPLTDLGQLDQIVAESETKPVLIFKHSTTCSISRMALKNFENEFDVATLQSVQTLHSVQTLQCNVSTYFLDLLNYRAVSNEIASRFNVVHQSPQILLIKDGIAVYNASHENIDATILKQKLK
jgi:bacillithiol system protein YtxJ